VISCFRRDVGKIYGLLRCYAAYGGNTLPTLRDNLWVSFSGIKKSKNSTQGASTRIYPRNTTQAEQSRLRVSVRWLMRCVVRFATYDTIKEYFDSQLLPVLIKNKIVISVSYNFKNKGLLRNSPKPPQISCE
jgi:hypothetical protein